MALTKDQKRDFWSALLTGRRARDPDASAVLADDARAILERRTGLVASFSLACAYAAVGLWIWIAEDRVTFFLIMGVIAVLCEGFLISILLRARRVNRKGGSD